MEPSMTPAFKTFSIVTPMVAAALALAACGEQTPAQTPETTAETAAGTDTALTPATSPAATNTILGKVDLNQPVRLLGNEPGWTIDITPASVTYVANIDAPKVLAENKGVTIQGDTATWTTQTQAGLPMQITATLKDCSDTMSDRVYSLTATAKVGDTTHTGCAASLKGLEAAGESGRVE